ncbi:MAG: CPBP family intramembrane metalloprotease [Armatimonadetes bacterium]|nr:CPBP family intramembrane metalloprotease [Armatimonadota bacterium]
MSDVPESSDFPRVPPVMPGQQRNPWTWAVLGAIFLVLIGFALYGNFRPEHEAVASADAELVTLRMQTAMSALQEQVLAASDETSKAQLKQAMDKNVDTLRKQNRESAAKLAKAKHLSTDNARVLLALEREAGDQPDSRALHVLANSKDLVDRNVAEIYGSDTLTKADAERLSPKSHEFLDRLAAVHAQEKAGGSGLRKGLVNIGAVLALFVFVLFAMALVVAGGVVWIVHLAARTNGAAPRGLPVQFMSKAAADRFALRMALYLAGYIGISILNQRFLHLDSVLSGCVGLASVAVFVVLMLKVPVLGVDDPINKIAGKKPLQGIVGPALAAWAANGPLMVGMVLLSSVLVKFFPTPSHPVTQELASTTDPLKLGLIFLTASVLAPFIEETTFRGLLFPALSTLTGKPWVGMVVSGLLFASIHPQGPALWPALAGLGALMAYLTYWTGSIVPGMVLHGLHNGAILLVSILINSL